MKIASWNMNSIRSPSERLLQWMGDHQPDVLCLQDFRVARDKSPFKTLR